MEPGGHIQCHSYIWWILNSLIFAAQLRHRWHNPGDEITTAIFVLAGFEQGERPSEFHISSGLKGEMVSDDDLDDDEDFDEDAEIEEI